MGICGLLEGARELAVALIGWDRDFRGRRASVSVVGRSVVVAVVASGTRVSISLSLYDQHNGTERV